MSWQDRPYSGEGSGPELRIQFRRPSMIVTWLIIANVVIFLVQLISLRSGLRLDLFLGLSADGIRHWYLWQLVTYMFLHDPDSVRHILINMLGLYIFGTEFERHFGRQKFLQFYGICGIVGGLAYVLLGAANAHHWMRPLIGASGAIYGLLLAAIIFWPHIQVVLIIFPMPVRVFGLIVIAILVLELLSGGISNPGGEVCHFAGAAAGLGVFYMWGIMPQVRIGSGQGVTLLPGSGSRPSRREGAWARRQQQLAEEQAEVDRILAKVHDHGIQSLNRKERKALSRATQRQRERESDLHRVDRL